MKIHTTLYFVLILFTGFAFSACDDDNENPAVPLEADVVPDLNAVSTTKFTFFSFEENAIVANEDSATTKWDIGFRGTTIILNGGTSGPGGASGQIVDGVFNELIEAPETGYSSDSESQKAILGSNGWYTYTGTTSVPNHTILPIAGKILALKTSDGKYVKLEIISYYQGNPDTTAPAFADPATRPAARHYTFRYIFQPNGTRNLEVTK
jgi:hypothetical protein